MPLCDISGCPNEAITPAYGPNVCIDHFWTKTPDEEESHI